MYCVLAPQSALFPAWRNINHDNVVPVSDKLGYCEAGQDSLHRAQLRVDFLLNAWMQSLCGMYHWLVQFSIPDTSLLRFYCYGQGAGDPMPAHRAVVMRAVTAVSTRCQHEVFTAKARPSFRALPAVLLQLIAELTMFTPFRLAVHQ